ncbi:MAG: ribulose-phosphate 3-epimerase [Bacteroidales bacterium]|nr:ribulose-phosphate 3-epimerase [Bacteroidales bacterium]
MNKFYLSVSVMCSDLMNLGADIDILQKNGVDWLHVDVMDAHFVPNLTFGPDFIKAMHAHTELPLDIHLMVTDPELVLSRFDLRSGDSLSVHTELARDYTQLSREVRAKGCRFGLVLNPETQVGVLETYKGLFDTVTLMLVHPGYAGAKMVEGIMDKVAETRRWLDEAGLQDVLISVDGSVSVERAVAMYGMGARIFVGGTAAIYRKGMELSDTIRTFRETLPQF